MNGNERNSHAGFRWAPLVLRLIVGYGFLAHGIAKLARGPGAFAAILQAIGVPGPHLMAWITILTELIGGIAVLLGAFVTVVSLPMAALLLVAIFAIHLPYGFTSVKLIAVTPAGARFGPVGYETNLLYLACIASLVLTGPGPFALHHRKPGWRIALRTLFPPMQIRFRRDPAHDNQPEHQRLPM